ncbi:MAG: hypothetical protein J5944_09460 [Lentisphaeria bacterium]|nr:hypothetical protein [Lentisphaeria bacterium]
MKRRFPLIAALLSFSLCFLFACSRNDTKAEDPKDNSSSEEKGEAEETTEAEHEPARVPVPEPPRFTVEAVLSGNPESIDLAAVQLSSGDVISRSANEPPVTGQKDLLTLNVFLYPLHKNQFRCRITDLSGTLLEERILPPDQLPALLKRAVEKSGSSSVVEFAVKGEGGNKENPAWVHELKMRLIRSSRIRIRPMPPAPAVISVSGSINGQIFSVTIEKYLLGVHHVAAMGFNSMKRAAERLCGDFKSVPDPDDYLPELEAEACLDDLYRLSGTMKTFRRADYEKIDALTLLMTSLVPEDPRFRFERLWFSLLPLLDPALSQKQKKAISDSFLKDASDFLRKYPDFPFPVLPSGDSRPFAGHPRCPLDPVRDSPEAAPVVAWLLTLNAEEGADPGMIPEPGPHASRAELLGWCEAVRARSIGGLPGADPVSLARFRFRNQLALLRRVRSYIGAHPAEAAAVTPKTFFFPFAERAPGNGRDEFWKMVRFLILSEGKELIREAAALGTKASLRYAAELQALFDWSRSRGTGDDLRKALAAKMDSLLKTGFRLRPGISCGGYLTDMISVLSPESSSGEKLSVILQAYPFEHVFQKKGLDANQTMLAMVEAGTRDPGFLIRHAEKIRSLASRRFTDPTANSSYSILAESLFRRGMEDPQTDPAILRLNDGFDIRRIPSAGGRCLASCLYKNTLYMLRRDERDSLSVTAADLSAGTATDLAMPPVRFQDLQGAVRLSGDPELCVITASDGSLAVCGENTILLYDLDREIWKKCAGLPGRFPVCVRVWDGRLFYLCGGIPGPDGSDKVLSLHSCNPDGSDPRVYFSGDRPLLHAFDTLGRGRVSGFFQVRGGWLFTVSSRNHYTKTALFNPEKGELSYVEDLPPAFRLFAMTENAGALLGQGGDAFFLCPDRDPRKRSWLFSQSDTDPSPAALRVPGCGAFQMPAALLDGRYLVSARSGASPVLIDLQDWKKSPLLFLPECAGVYCGPEPRTLVFPAVSDGTVFIFRMKQPR